MENTQNDFLEIQPEDIHKALDELEALGEIDPISKGESEGEKGGTNAKMTSKKKSSEESEEDEEDEDEEEEEEVKKGEEEEEEFEADEEEQEEEEEEFEDDVEKALDVSPVLRTFDNRMKHMSSEQNKAFANVGKIMKGMYGTILSLQDEIKDLKGQSQGRKSVATTKGIDRFSKGEEGTPMADGKQVLNQKIHKGQILNILDDMAFSGNSMDDEMAKAMTSFELNTPLTPAVRARIEKEKGVKII